MRIDSFMENPHEPAFFHYLLFFRLVFYFLLKTLAFILPSLIYLLLLSPKFH